MTDLKGSAPLKIGFLGPGAMGTGMVTRLLDPEHSVNVFARNPAKIQGLLEAGANYYGSPAQLVRDSDLVLGCLLDSAVIRDLYMGSGGIIEHAREGQVFVEHATFDPALAEQISRLLEHRGAHFVDAPVSGGPTGALNGTLVTMLGGDPDIVEGLLPVLSIYCTRIKHVGSIGSGLRLKLINQLLVSVHAVAAAEASALVIRSGINPTAAHEALMGGWAASTMLDLQLPKACSSDFAAGGAAIGGLIEIQRLVTEFCTESDFHSRLLEPVKEVFGDAVKNGHGDNGLSSLVSQYHDPNEPVLTNNVAEEQS